MLGGNGGNTLGEEHVEETGKRSAGVELAKFMNRHEDMKYRGDESRKGPRQVRRSHGLRQGSSWSGGDRV